MTKTGVLLIAQDMVIGQNRNAVIFLRVQAAYPRQAVADADLIPGLVQAVFEFIQNGIAQVGAQSAKGRASAIGRVIDGRIFPGDEILVTERLVQVAQSVLNALLALHFLKVVFINKAGTEPEAKFVIIRRRGKGRDDLPCANIAHINHGVTYLSPDGSILSGLHILSRKPLLTYQAGRRPAGNQQQKEKEHAHEHRI